MFPSRRAVLLGAALTAVPVMARATIAPPILAALRADDVAALDEALSGADREARDENGATALLLAVAGDRRTVAERLIALGADINAVAANHDTPWLLAGALGRTALLAAMLKTGKVDYTKRNRYGGNALIPACERGHVETVRLLLEQSKIDVDHVNNLGWTGLLEAVILGDGSQRHVEIVRLLLAHRADPNLADRDGVTPLQHARKRGQATVIPLLEAAGGR